ncbi:MAG: carboxypeptidase regulatory-like domain-containing protein, partial [Candidatus Odinarchaeota archaeon]
MSHRTKIIILLFSMCCTSGFLPDTLFATVFSGYVYDMVTKEPIPGASIEIGNAATSFIDITTDSQGCWEISGLQDANDYTILASATGYASEEVVLQSPPGSYTFYLKAPTCGYLVDTINRGAKHYEFNGAFCHLNGGEVTDGTDFFPDPDASNTTITAFLALLGAGTNQTTSASEMWTRIIRTWEWLGDNALADNDDPTWDQADALMGSGNGWPSIALMAETYMTYGFIPWGTC